MSAKEPGQCASGPGARQNVPVARGQEVELLGYAVSFKIININQLIANGDFHIQMIDLGKSKEVTAILKL